VIVLAALLIFIVCVYHQRALPMVTFNLLIEAGSRFESAGREAPSSNWGALRRFLPVPAPLPSGGDTAWRELAAAVAWNYSHFLVGTRA